MKFELLYELQIPKPHDERSENRRYQEALEQIELADRPGIRHGVGGGPRTRSSIMAGS